MGTPDAVIDLPAFTLPADQQEHVAEFTLPGTSSDRLVRGVDILPGSPAMVRSATVEAIATPSTGGVREEQLLALWVPGDRNALLARGAFRIPAGASLRVRLRYRRTWSYEGKAMTDQSRIGLYSASTPSSPVRAVVIAPASPVTLPATSYAVAIYPDETLAGAAVMVAATRPDGRREELIAFHPRAGWARRFWFREPITLPRGTTLSARLVPDPPAVLPASVATASASGATSATGRVTVNVTQ